MRCTPAFIKSALAKRGLKQAYDARPPYQRNDYVGWITRAKRPETQQKRLATMLDELAAGQGYMGMTWRPTPARKSQATRLTVVLPRSKRGARDGTLR